MINTMKTGSAGFKSNDRIATALVLKASLGLWVEDIFSLKISDIITDGGRYRLNIIEKRQHSTFTVPVAIYNYIVAAK